MSGKEATPERVTSRADSIWAALVLGLPMSAGVIMFLRQPAFHDTLIERYMSHPVEYVEVTAFCCAVAALLAKVWGWLWQRRAIRANILPAWDGSPLSPAAAPAMLSHLARLPRSLRRSWVGQRCRSILDFVCRRHSAAGLDDHMRMMADNDAMAMENSYSFIRLVIWAVPILGFIGTVLGIATAIAGVSPEQLEHDLSGVTGGLATAFDTTGLALMLTMVMMLLTFLVERLEQGALQGVDGYIDEQLFHRFARTDTASSPMLLEMETLVQKQADIWARSMMEMEGRLREQETQQQENLTAALQLALEGSLRMHQDVVSKQMAEVIEPIRNLTASIRQQVVALKPLAEGMIAMSEALGRLQEGEGQMLRLQKLLQHNLAGLAQAGAFEEAVHSLSAAVHMLTARSGMTGTLRAAV